MSLFQTEIRFGFNCLISDFFQVHCFFTYKILDNVLSVEIFFIGKTLVIQDLKPRFHSSRFHGSDNGEDDVCY